MTVFTSPREVIMLRSVDQAAAADLAEKLNVSTAVARILVGRGLTTYEACKDFFTPDASGLRDPFLFKDMRAAVDRVLAAIDKGDRIAVYGDYDVDGVTGTALLVRFLQRLGATCDYYLPNRLTEGYGLSAEGIDTLAGRGVKLIVTVDCGIGSREHVARAARAGIDVVLTDHHEPHGELPNAAAILDPKVEGCGYPGTELAGVGVALKLCHGLAKARGMDDASWLEYLDLVSLGTAADIVPLTGENRIIASLGFERLGHTTNPGLRALMELQGIDATTLSTGQVVFQLAPCINAAGRLGDPGRGVQLLLTEDPAEAKLYARELREANIERRALDSSVQEQVVAWVEAHCDPSRDFAIVAAHHEWHAGVIGIAASRVVESFCRPTFLFSIGEDGLAKGSGRSAGMVHLLECVHECTDLLENYGGHAAAAGATIKKENIDAFRARFNEAVRARTTLDDLVPRVVADAEVELGALSRKFFNIVKRMAPFGPGNMRPVLLCRGLRNRYEPRVVGRGHLKMSVTSNGLIMDAIGFNFGERLEEVRRAPSYSLAFSLDENEWNGKVSLQMKVKGVEV
ncbi:MAG: single-stranded-DNA-specific exonuclease RecJ [Chitinivibrionales bacterium]|nr:single-stranded-DNA-specific exonuclease RecJ [Chitinivibrionales bacterium]MBD3395007.1 single-stranded-DNA-specific exonuclease RecJ [Chitinivibrionales bacterium]